MYWYGKAMYYRNVAMQLVDLAYLPQFRDQVKASIDAGNGLPAGHLQGSYAAYVYVLATNQQMMRDILIATDNSGYKGGWVGTAISLIDSGQAQGLPAWQISGNVAMAAHFRWPEEMHDAETAHREQREAFKEEFGVGQGGAGYCDYVEVATYAWDTASLVPGADELPPGKALDVAAVAATTPCAAQSAAKIVEDWTG